MKITINKIIKQKICDNFVIFHVNIYQDEKNLGYFFVKLEQVNLKDNKIGIFTENNVCITNGETPLEIWGNIFYNGWICRQINMWDTGEITLPVSYDNQIPDVDQRTY